jgi:GrpB-like predicted nucleotidyltransferase (UPF0157 family)
MPAPIPVELVAYDTNWPVVATCRAAELRVLGDNLIAVHHIGSTSVPGLVAKPIIDLMPVISSMIALDAQREAVERLGYRWHGELGIAGRRYCALRDANGSHLVHLHCFEANAPDVVRHIAFRDYLRELPAIAGAYAIEKQRAWALHPSDSHAYSREKGAWIRRTEADALAWYAAR